MFSAFLNNPVLMTLNSDQFEFNSCVFYYTKPRTKWPLGVNRLHLSTRVKSWTLASNLNKFRNVWSVPRNVCDCPLFAQRGKFQLAPLPICELTIVLGGSRYAYWCKRRSREDVRYREFHNMLNWSNIPKCVEFSTPSNSNKWKFKKIDLGNSS